MSDIFQQHLTFHVFTPDGDLYVSDSADGDRAPASLVTQYPDALVRTEDRDTGEVLAEDMPLIRLLNEERGLYAIGVWAADPGDQAGAA
jgi:hypothetical protein